MSADDALLDDVQHSGHAGSVLGGCMGGDDALEGLWHRMCREMDKRKVLLLLKRMDETRVLIGEDGARMCCKEGLRAVDGMVRCVACGRRMV